MDGSSSKEAPLDPQDCVETTASTGNAILPLALGEGHLLEVLSQKLPKYMAQPDVQVLLDELRDELYAEINFNTSLKQLHQVTKACNKCPNLGANQHLPAWNVEDPDCVLINESPNLDKEILGLITNGLRSSGFSSKRVCMTYVNRCRVLDYRKYTPEEINNCVYYLQTELQLLKPKLIVPLGLAASSVLLGPSIKLAEVRGKVLWLGPWAVMPTFSPRYVLMSGEKQKEIFHQDMEYAFKFCYGEPISE